MAEFASASAEKDIILVSGDNEEFQVSKKVAEMSMLAKSMITEDEGDEDKRVPLPNVKSNILSKVIDYCKHYIDEPMTEFVKVNLFLFFNLDPVLLTQI
jgi:S-phase kinase-associated protein 1